MKTFLIILAFVLNLLSNFQVQPSSSGVRSRNKRIVGGSEAPKNAMPWTVSLQENNGHFCGGILISENYVLTSAHCFHGFNYNLPTGLQVIIGLHDRRIIEASRQEIKAAKLIIHENYARNPNQKLHDIALIKLNVPVKLTKAIVPISLEAKPFDNLENKDVWISGWGSDNKGPPVAVKKQVKIKIWNDKTCGGTIGSDYDQKTMLCGGGNGAGGCVGDSGGPLSYYKANEKKWLFVGIVSFLAGKQCGANTVFTKVSAYQGWIRKYEPKI